MYKEAISKSTERVLAKITGKIEADFYLAGGTALARLADERDIAAMKLDAVSSRGSKKDFIDIHFLLEKYSLSELLEIFEKKYAAIKFNKIHILKSLSYFEDAESDPMPIMLKPILWEVVKKKIVTETNQILR
jgi:hypothetical protein